MIETADYDACRGRTTSSIREASILKFSLLNMLMLCLSMLFQGRLYEHVLLSVAQFFRSDDAKDAVGLHVHLNILETGCDRPLASEFPRA